MKVSNIAIRTSRFKKITHLKLVLKDSETGMWTTKINLPLWCDPFCLFLEKLIENSFTTLESYIGPPPESHTLLTIFITWCSAPLTALLTDAQIYIQKSAPFKNEAPFEKICSRTSVRNRCHVHIWISYSS